MADFGIFDRMQHAGAERLGTLLTRHDDGAVSVGHIDRFEALMAAFNRRVAASGRLGRIRRWQIVGDEGHA